MNRVSDEKKCIICLLLVILAGFVLVYTYTAKPAENDYEGIIRLHVLANSNTMQDQALKLKVRDGIIEYMEKQKEIEDADKMREYLNSDLRRIEKIAEGIIASEGYNYSANACLGIRYIPEKTYGDITFPAGNYEALNVTIGSGRGENWWCVLFPPLCILDEGSETPDGADDSAAESQQLQLRWKLLDILNKDTSKK